MRSTLLIAGILSLSTGLFAQKPSAVFPTDSAESARLMIGEWHFVHVLGSDGKVTDHIIRSQGPGGQKIQVKANGPEITIWGNGSYVKRFTPENNDTGYWSLKQPNEVTYTMVIPMESKQGQMLAFAAKMFNKPTPTDGQGNYLDTSTDILLLLTTEEMHVREEEYIYVYRKN